MSFLAKRTDGTVYGTQPRSRGPNIPDPMRRTSLLTTSHATGLGDFPSVMGIVSGSPRTGYLAPQILGQTVIGDLLGRFSRPVSPAFNPRGSHLPASGLTSRALSTVDGARQTVASGLVGGPRQVRMASVDMHQQGLIGNFLRSFEQARVNVMQRFGII